MIFLERMSGGKGALGRLYRVLRLCEAAFAYTEAGQEIELESLTRRHGLLKNQPRTWR